MRDESGTREPDTSEPGVAADATSRGRTASAVIAGASIAVSVAIVAGVFLWLVASARLVGPPGFDTPKYIWRANLVEGEGLSALEGSSPFREHPDRVGYPVMAAMVRSVTGIDAFDLGFILPAVMAAVVGLAAGAFAVRVLSEPRWAFPVYAALVGISANVVLTSSGLLDNLVLDGVVMGAAATALVASAGGGTVAATLVLVGAAALTHWPLTAVFLAVLAAVAVVAFPGSLRARRSGQPLLATPSGRLAIVVAASAAVVAAALAALSVPLQAPRTRAVSFLRKLDRFVPRYQVPITGVAAALGAAALWFPKDSLRRRGLALALIWAATAAVAVPLLVALELELPAHRFLLFALGIPVLGAAAVVGVGRLLLRIPVPVVGGVLAALVAVAGLAVGIRVAQEAWSERVRVKFPTDGLVQTGQAGVYLERVGHRGPVIFVINPGALGRIAQAVTLTFGAIRSGLPASQVASTYVYLGDPANLLAGEPTVDTGDRGFDRSSLKQWALVEPLLSRDPVILQLAAFNRGLREGAGPAGVPLAPGVTLLRGPPPPAAPPPVPVPRPPSAGELIARFAAVLALVWVVGSGWAAWLVRGPAVVAASLAPALGVALLIVGGTVLGRLAVDAPGVRRWSVVAVAVVGWVWPAYRRWFGRRGHHHAGAAPSGIC